MEVGTCSETKHENMNTSHPRHTHLFLKKKDELLHSVRRISMGGRIFFAGRDVLEHVPPCVNWWCASPF